MSKEPGALHRRVVVTSTGNLGIAVAAYCAVAGMDCLFIAPHETARPILDQARLHGARVIVTSRAHRQQLLEQVARRDEWFPVGLFLPRPVQNPFGVEGYKTFAYEIVEDFGGAPAAVLFPCARGNGLYGAWKGFRDVRTWAWTDGLPRMVACQPAGGNSLEVALDADLEHAPELTPAESIAVSANETVSDDHALAAIRESGGAAVSANDDEITEAARQLGQEGLCVEASSALPVACLPQLLDRGAIQADEAVVFILTATGMRWPSQVALAAPDIFEVDGDTAALDRFLAERFSEPAS